MSEDIPPIDRCIAAANVPRSDLERLFSVSHASNMANAGRRIDRALHERLRDTWAPFRRLFALYGFPVEDQPSVLDDWICDEMQRLGGAEEGPPEPRPTAREARAVQKIVDTLGLEEAMSLLKAGR
ncbi:MAG: hypothetical protein L6Q76_17215 [Polyangiaceae bacterium]|nr:hypothetical protein [Polyangiaceae bacterium]